MCEKNKAIRPVAPVLLVCAYSCIFLFQLSRDHISVVDMASTMEEYQGWLEGTVDNHVKNTFEKAKTKLEDIMPYEKALVSSL